DDLVTGVQTCALPIWALEPIRERTRRITLPDVREERRVRAIERYRDFIDSASDGIVVLDGTGAVLYLNRAAEEVTGYARDGLAGGREGAVEGEGGSGG